MAAADRLEVTVHGRGGHAATPHHAADPIPAACEMVTALQTFATRRFDVFDPVVITVGSFHAGTADNIIPDKARFLTTIRSFSAETRTRVKDGTTRMVREIAEAHGLTVTTEYLDGYPVTITDQSEAAFAEHAVAGLFGRDRFDPQKYPMTSAEDFSFVLERVPGAFLFVGACPPDRVPATAPNNHSAEAVFDDAVLSDGTALYAELALRRLTGS
jgi:hippurate hydrolase